MRPALEQGLLNGRLECPNQKCQAQIGRYAWQGMRCSCGVWVCPAFSLQKGRADEITKRGENIQGPGQGQGKAGDRVGSAGARDEAGGIRLPPGMRGKENL
jgi:dual specificity phosphatase 12